MNADTRDQLDAAICRQTDPDPYEVMQRHAGRHRCGASGHVRRFGTLATPGCETYRLAEALAKAIERERATKEALAETLTKAIKREQRARAEAWARGYSDGVNDQATAAAMPLGYWVPPARDNPYAEDVNG